MSAHFIMFQYTKTTTRALTQYNQCVAEAASAEGPSSLVGKRDEDLPWADRLSEYMEQDRIVVEGGVSQVYQLATFTDGKEYLLLNNKSPLLDKHNKVIGIIGSSLDVTGLLLATKKPTILPDGSLVIYINSQVICLSKEEATVLTWILRGIMPAEISLLTNQTKSTINGHLMIIKRKLQVQTIGDIICLAHHLGLLQITFKTD